MTNDDMALVRDYAAGQSESAFATLVVRFIDLVYSTALRQVREPHLAEEITQAVFIILARKAGTLGADTILPSWLYRTTGFVAADALKAKHRRLQREQEAYMQSALNEPEDESWRQIAPLLDAAIAGLGEKDRHAVVLRFFQNKSLNEIGAALGVTEAAAKKRVHRAVEKLRAFFLKRGVSSTAETIAGAISVNSVQAAPVALAKAVTAVAIAKGTAASVSTLTLIKGALKIMAWTKAKTAIVVGAAILLTAATSTVVIQTAKHYRTSSKLEMRTFAVNGRALSSGLRNAASFPADASIIDMVTNYFASKGLNFAPPKSVFFNDPKALLFVKATPADLNAVEKIIQQLTFASQQVHMKAYFIDVPESNVDAILKAGTAINSANNNIVEIMTDAKAAPLLRQIGRGGSDILAEPEVVSLTGLHTEMRAVQTQMGTPNPTVDLVPTVLADGYTVRMKAIVYTPETLTAQVNIWDGQTLVLAPTNSNDGKTRLFVFVTANLVDPAGNLIHSKTQLPFNPSTIPPQE